MKRTYGPGSDPTGWLRQYHRPPADAPTLVAFPHAGGSATGYYTLSAALSDSAEVLNVQYPGRQDRLGERCVDDIGEMADRVVEALLPGRTGRSSCSGTAWARSSRTRWRCGWRACTRTARRSA